MSVSTDDIVRSRGRIKVIQDGRTRYIRFEQGKVLDVGPVGITVNPLGMKAIFACRPEDLEPVVTGLEQTPVSRASGKQEAEQHKPGSVVTSPEQWPDFEPGGTVPAVGEVVQVTAKDVVLEPEGSIDVTGEVAKPKAKKLPPPRRRRRDR